MNTLADLHRTVQAALAGKRLGKPVFVRYLYQGRDTAEAVLPRLARITAAVQDWLGQPLDRLYAVGSAAGGQVTLTAEGREGATALISFARDPRRDGTVDLTVLGNHGALYQSLDSGQSFSSTEKGPLEKEYDPKLLAAIGRALQTGQPETLNAGGVP
jgi:hypothetical protein